MRNIFSITALFFIVTITAQTQPFYSTTAGDGNGFRFWGTNNNYKIHMGNSSEYHYGPVTDYSIKMNMNSLPGRGWTWGVGGATPIAALNTQGNMQIKGSFKGSLQHTAGYLWMYPYNASYDDGSAVKAFYDGNRKQIRFWNSDSNTDYTGLETGGISVASRNVTNSVNGFENRIEFKNGGHAAIVFHPAAHDELMFGMHNNGNFYWGTGRFATKPNYYSMYLNGNNGDLGIRGKLTANEVKVKLGGWADFVFEKDYNLPSLTEVENHIQEKGHLQDIPSAKEVAENGIFLGEMDAKLLQKIEELMLYTIAQDKQLKAQQTENKQLKTKNQELEARLAKLEKILLPKN